MSRRVQRTQWHIMVTRQLLTVAVAAVALGGDPPRQRHSEDCGRLPRGRRRSSPSSAGWRPMSLSRGVTVAGAACTFLLISIFFMSVFTYLATIGQGLCYARTVSERSIEITCCWSQVTPARRSGSGLTRIADLLEPDDHRRARR